MADSIKKEDSPRLSDKQLMAIIEILRGKSDTAVAESVGVSRQTLLNWRKDDPYFVVELNKRRQELWEGFISGLRDLVDKSLGALHKSIEMGDVKTSLWFLEKMRLEDIMHEHLHLTKPAGPTDVDELFWQQARAVAEKTIGVKNKPSIPDPLEEDVFGQRFQNEDTILRETGKIARLLKKNTLQMKASIGICKAA